MIQPKKSNTNSLRLFHGRGKQNPKFEQASVDYFAPNLLITLFHDYDESQIAELINLATENSQLEIENILVQKRFLNRPELKAIKGEIPAIAYAIEEEMKFNLKFGETQNIGFFLDMYNGRELLRKISKDKKVLNLFSYTCSLSVAALSGGASGVVNVDMSKAALQVGESNHSLNSIDQRNVRFLNYDIMKSWNKIYKNGPYDIVVIDPPTNQGDSFRVDRDYYKVIKRLDEMTADNAIVMACLNSPHLTTAFLIELFKEHAPHYIVQETIYSAFSPMEVNPEEGLKILVLKKSK